MKHRGAFTVFATAFVVVLIGGLALAQVGVLRPAPAGEPEFQPIAAAADSSPAAAEAAATAAESSPGDSISAVDNAGSTVTTMSTARVAPIQRERTRRTRRTPGTLRAASANCSGATAA